MFSNPNKTNSHPHSVTITDSNNYSNVQYVHSFNRVQPKRPRRRPSQASSSMQNESITSNIFSGTPQAAPIPNGMPLMPDWSAFAQSITGSAHAQAAAAAAVAHAQVAHAQSIAFAHPAYAQWPPPHHSSYSPSSLPTPNQAYAYAHPAPGPAPNSASPNDAKSSGRRKSNSTANMHRSSSIRTQESSVPMSECSPQPWCHHPPYGTSYSNSIPMPVPMPTPAPMSAPPDVSGVNNYTISNINSGNSKSIVINNSKNASGRSGNRKTTTITSHHNPAGAETGMRTVHTSTTRVSQNAFAKSRINDNMRLHHVSGGPLIQEQIIEENWDSDTESISSQEEENKARSPLIPLPQPRTMRDEHLQAKDDIPDFPPPEYSAVVDDLDNGNGSQRTASDENLDVKTDYQGPESTSSSTTGSQSSAVDSGSIDLEARSSSTASFTSWLGRWMRGSR